VTVIEEESRRPTSPEVIGHALDQYFGTWSPEEAAELLEAIEVFEEVDETLWT
jgi:hypothetical protein